MPGAGRHVGQWADLPKGLQERFADRRFIGADPDLLDHEGVEFVLIGAARDVADELGVGLDAEPDSVEPAETVRRLRLPPEAPVESLTEGQWR